MLKDLLIKNRSYRTFFPDAIAIETLMNIVENTRYCGSARNSQPLRYIIINSEQLVNDVFSHTKWAGALQWNPSLNESPAAYILICSEKSQTNSGITLGIDIGISAQSMLLSACELGLGGCLLGAFNKTALEEILQLPKDKYDLNLLVALGYPKDKSHITIPENNNLTYSRNIETYENFVPKIELKKLILGIY
ncbi:nitroreductase family protein [Cetobacterium ceti]